MPFFSARQKVDDLGIKALVFNVVLEIDSTQLAAKGIITLNVKDGQQANK